MKTSMRHPSPARQQRGAALFIALMLLIIVSILGVSVAQVSALQERMASNYRVDDLAFQNAEGTLRSQELDITSRLAGKRSATCRPDESVGGGVNRIPEWKATAATENQAGYESLQDNYGAGRSTGLAGNVETGLGGAEAGSWACLMFRVAAVGVGFEDDASGSTIVQTTYIME